MLEVEQVKTIKDCYEIASMDVYDDEFIAAWHACLSDALESIEECKIFNETVAFHGVTIQGNSVVAEVSKDDEDCCICLSSLKLIGAKKTQKLWVKAYLEYNN